MNLLRQRVRLAFTTWPNGRGWVEAAVLFLVFAAATLILGTLSGFLRLRFGWTTVGTAHLLAHVAGSLVFPALVEETFFRVLLLPHRLERAPRARWVTWAALSLVLYVFWHPLTAWLLLPVARGVFTDPVFLTVTALLGLACTTVYLRTGSIWPAVLIHWLVVVVWKAFFGGLMWW